MVHDIEAAMDQDIDTLDWMSPATKARAKEKLHAVADKIGYPDHWRDYSKLIIVRDDASATQRAAEFRKSIANSHKIGKPVDRGEWGMSPAHGQRLLQPQHERHQLSRRHPAAAVLRSHATDAENYGHIGAIVGHELTHGFDDRAASSTPTAISTTGGPPKTARSSTRRPIAK